MVFNRDEILSHDGYCGIERIDWERSKVRATQIAAINSDEGKLESELLYDSGNRFGIYQVKKGEDLRDYRFTSMNDLINRELDVIKQNYELKYTAPFVERVEFLSDKNPVLNDIYKIFNTEPPEDYTGRSVSVSDIIVLKCNGDITSHYVDSVGFVEIDHFLGEERAQLPELKAIIPEVNVLDTKNAATSDFDKAPHHHIAGKTKPSLMERLEANKQKVARQGQTESHKNKHMEVN
jgi:hypothetical protein